MSGEHDSLRGMNPQREPGLNGPHVVLVCGGRDYNDTKRVADVLGALRPRPAVIVHGCARGADRLAAEWAEVSAAQGVMFTANWSAYGPSAGPIRNRNMLTMMRPTLVVAFPGGRGTADMVRKARAAGVPVLEVPRG